MVESHLRQRAAGDQGSIGCLSVRADHYSGFGNRRREQGTGVDGAGVDDVGSASWKVGGGGSEGEQVVQDNCLGPDYYWDCHFEHDPPLSCKSRDVGSFGWKSSVWFFPFYGASVLSDRGGCRLCTS